MKHWKASLCFVCLTFPFSLSFLSHCCVAVKVSTAQHLHQLADRLGAAHVFRAGKTYTERFLIAVSKQSLDAAPEVRSVYHVNDLWLLLICLLSIV